jgi:hypothetical protein
MSTEWFNTFWTTALNRQSLSISRSYPIHPAEPVPIFARTTIYGEEGRKKLKITKALFKRWEDFPEIVRDLDNLCQILKEPAI